MSKLMVKFDRASAGKHVGRWKKGMDRAIRRAVKASRRAILMTNNSGSPHKAARLVIQRAVDRQHVGALADFVHIGQRDAHFVRRLAR